MTHADVTLEALTPEEKPVAPERFREAMSRVAATVTVVTTDGPAGRAGFTATAFSSVTDQPATVLVCLNRASASHHAMGENGVFCVNVLPSTFAGIADAFAGRSGLVGPERFTLGAWSALQTGAPVMDAAIAAFDCRLQTATDIGTHTVLFGEVVGVVLGPHQSPLVYLDRRYVSP